MTEKYTGDFKDGIHKNDDTRGALFRSDWLFGRCEFAIRPSDDDAWLKNCYQRGGIILQKSTIWGLLMCQDQLIIIGLGIKQPITTGIYTMLSKTLIFWELVVWEYYYKKQPIKRFRFKFKWNDAIGQAHYGCFMV